MKFDRVVVANHPGFIDTSGFIQFKTDDTPSFVVGRLISETASDITVQHPLMVGCFASGGGESVAAMGTVTGTADSDYEDEMEEEPQASGMFQVRTVGFVARKYCPLARQGLVTFEKNKLLSVSEPTEDLVRFWSEFDKKFGKVMDDALTTMLKKMDPVRSKRLMIPKDSHENLIAAEEAGDTYFAVDDSHSKMVH